MVRSHCTIALAFGLLIALPVAGEDAGVTVQLQVDALQPNTFRFAVARARHLRVQILASSSRGQPGIDEIEIFGPESDENLALHTTGAKATASSCLPGYDKHKIEHLNDGQYGNLRSWISGAKTGWAQITLPEAVRINQIVLSRDRGGRLRDRTPVSFDILVSMNGKEWETVKKVRPPKVQARDRRRPRDRKQPKPAESNPFAYHSPEALRRALDDLATAAPDRFPDAADLARQVDSWAARWPGLMGKITEGDKTARTQAAEFAQLQREILLRNPLLDFDTVLLVKRHVRQLGLPLNFHGLSFEKRGGYDNEIAALSLKEGTLRRVWRPAKETYVGEADLHFDGQRLMFTTLDDNDRYQIYETNIDGTGLRQISKSAHPDIDNYDSVYLPDERVIFSSTSGFHGVPCHGGKGDVANLHIMNSDGTGVRRLCFEQDHDWYPVMLANGRVMYLRWEYTDSAHYFSRILMHMNPDGTDQKALYGSNSYWPNAMFYARPLPGETNRFVSIVSGHHGVKRAGQLFLFDCTKGRREDTGVVQQIPGWGKAFKGEIKDKLVDGKWPQFLHPFPLSDKYFLVSVKLTPEAPWGLYLVDVFDNLLLLKQTDQHALLEPIPLRATPRPPVIPDRVDLGSRTATCLIQDIYEGGGLRGVPRGTVKRLRLFQYEYGYRMMGGHYLIGMESGWDVRRILGTVPVHKDGSTSFMIPANTPVAIQPLDENGRALQQMRSWLVGMPGEVVSCVGCHEKQDQALPVKRPAYASRKPSVPEPWHGPVRGFSFEREVQPVLNRHCVGCHKGQAGRPDFAPSSARLGTDKQISGFPKAYWALHPYVRRNGPEGDYHLLTPLEFHANTSELVQMLEKGHHDVELDPEGWDRLITWIDLNVPYYGTWSEVRKVPGDAIKRRMEMKALYGLISEDVETPGPMADYPQTFLKPAERTRPPERIPDVQGWPFSPEAAQDMQSALSGTHEARLDLGDGVTMALQRIPTGRFVMGTPDGPPDERPLAEVEVDGPFWIGETEVSLAMYRQYDPDHHNGFYDMHYKDQVKPGYDMDKPELPVIRVSWDQAQGFCRWLSRKTGKKVTLPTEAQWEWACRAGSSAPLSFGNVTADYGKHANASDVTMKLAAVKGVDPKPIKNPNRFWDYLPKDANVDDGVMHLAPVDRYLPNAWGLRNMHGNVAEWTADAYRPYPYAPAGTEEAEAEAGQRRVVRGGSWNERIKRCTSSRRIPYPQWQQVYNVGFRVVVADEPSLAAAFAPRAERRTRSKPNVVLIMTDDQGYGDLSCHGNPILKTPNLDRLASQSVRLDDYHAAPYCVPSRASLLTGRYADRTGVHNMVAPDWIARGDEFMMGTPFKNAGYATGMFGKWHLGDNYPFGPECHDFDDVLRHYGGAVGVLADYWDNCYLDDTYYRNGKPTKVSGYCTDVFFSEATRFIAKAVKEDKPFFLYLATNAPHGPQICAPSYSRPYAGRVPERVQKFFGMIANIDENVGKLRGYLDEHDLADNTIFIFTTDNGTAGGAGVFNAGMEGNKGSTYDGGHRVPFFLHWPAGGFDQERRIRTLTANIDVFPTLLDLCELEAPEHVHMDGTSLRSLLEQGDHPGWADRILMTDMQKKELPRKWATTAVMSERWRLVDGKELYDIDADPGQKNNVFAQHPEVVQTLSGWYDKLWDDLEPSFEDIPRIVLGEPVHESVTLNYHDCVGRHRLWFQNGIRDLIRGRFRGKPVSMIDSAQSKRSSAFWPVDVVTGGEYRIELRRWPVEIDHPIHADLPSGPPVYGEKSHRSTPGVGFPAVKAVLTIDGRELTMPVDKATKAAVFETGIAAGRHRVSGKFFAEDGRSLDAFYVHATKVMSEQADAAVIPGNPNIVLILADDFGWGDASCNNPASPIKTPNIDRIANEGIRFTNAHTPSAVCTPTRYGLLTGRYPWRSYLKEKVLAYYAPALIRKGRTTLASYLKSQGYRTGGFGKWHLGLDWTPVEGDPMNWRSQYTARDRKQAARVAKGIDHTKPFGNAPTDIGFDTYFGTPSNASRLPFFIEDNRVVGDLKRDKSGAVHDPACARDKVDDIYVDRALAFIESHERDHADHPFFVYLPLNAIHGAVKVPARFEGKTGMTQREDKILWADQNVGRVLAALDRMALSDDTLLIFTTDNGPLNSPVARRKGHEPAGPYRGFKTCAWDGGTRVPFVARWPGRIPAGATTDHLIGLTDMLATFAALCGTPLPDDAGPDSVNQLPALLQQKEKIVPRPALVTATYRGLLTLRDGKWKAIFGTKWSGGHTNENYGGLGPGKTMDDPESGQLYDLEQDPGEQNDLWESHPERVQQLRVQIETIRRLEKDDEFPQ